MFWIRTVVSTDTTKKFVRRAHSVTHSYGKCKPIAASSFFRERTALHLYLAVTYVCRAVVLRMGMGGMRDERHPWLTKINK